ANVGIGPLLGYSTVADFGRALRPGWWVLRGYAVGMLALGLAFSGFRLVPRTDASLPVSLAVLALAIGLSVRVGRLGLPDRRRRALVVAANVAAVLLVAGGAAKAAQGPGIVYEGGGYVQYNNDIEDIYPYDEHGNPLSGVELYDQNGSQLHLGNPYRCNDLNPTTNDLNSTRNGPYRYPLCPLGPGGRIGPSPSPSAVPSANPSPNPSPSARPSPS